LFEFCHSDYSFDLDAIPQAYRRGLDTEKATGGFEELSLPPRFAHHETGGLFFDGPRRRDAAGRHVGRHSTPSIDSTNSSGTATSIVSTSPNAAALSCFSTCCHVDFFSMIFWQVLYQLAHVCQRLECHDVRYLERPGQRPRPVRAGQRDTPTQRALDKQWRAVTRRCGSGAVAAVYREVEALLRWLARVASEGYRALTWPRRHTHVCSGGVADFQNGGALVTPQLVRQSDGPEVAPPWAVAAFSYNLWIRRTDYGVRLNGKPRR
jgi:hypothetical protein